MMLRCLTTADIGEHQRRRFERQLCAAGQTYPGRTWDDVVVRVTGVEPGRWFTAGEPCDATLLSGAVPSGLSEPERCDLMLAFSRTASDILDQPVSHITVAIVDL